MKAGGAARREWRALRRLGPAGLAAVAAVGCHPASACTLAKIGRFIAVTGEILKGDEFKFRDFLAALDRSEVAAVRLNSPGGNIYASGEIGRQIRQAGLSTLVDASRDACASACTVLFASGVQRLYLHAPDASGEPGRGPLRGLGFHQGSTPDQLAAARYSGAGTALMTSYYYEFGVPGAASLADRAAPESIFAVSGASALSLGIATRLTASSQN